MYVCLSFFPLLLCPFVQVNKLTPKVVAMEIFRDTITGHFLRIVSGGKILPYEEDSNPSVWQKYIHKEKSGDLAHPGMLEPEEDDQEKSDQRGSSDNNDNPEQPSIRERQSETNVSRGSSGTRVDGETPRVKSVSGVKARY